MPNWLSWGNVSSCRLPRRHVFRERDMIGHRSAGRGRRGRLVSRSGSCAVEVQENGRILKNKNVNLTGGEVFYHFVIKYQSDIER